MAGSILILAAVSLACCLCRLEVAELHLPSRGICLWVQLFQKITLRHVDSITLMGEKEKMRENIAYFVPFGNSKSTTQLNSLRVTYNFPVCDASLPPAVSRS